MIMPNHSNHLKPTIEWHRIMDESNGHYTKEMIENVDLVLDQYINQLTNERE